jgi:hypothetical protein
MKMNFNEIFDGNQKSGIYRIRDIISQLNLETLCKENNFSLFTLPGSRIRNKEEFLEQYKEILKPPEYGENWDSVIDNLRTTDWLSSKGVIILYNDIQHFQATDPAAFRVALDVFDYVTKFRNERPHIPPLYILLQENDSITEVSKKD